MKFQSGNPVRAEDAAWSLQRAVKLNKSPAFILTQFGLTPERRPDGDVRGLRLTLSWTSLCAIYVLNCLFSAEVASVVDKETVMAHVEGDDFGNAWLSTHSAGSGPFSLAAWRPNEVVQFAANPIISPGQARHGAGDRAQRAGKQRPAAAAEQGDIDVAWNLVPTDVDGIAGNDNEGRQ